MARHDDMGREWPMMWGGCGLCGNSYLQDSTELDLLLVEGIYLLHVPQQGITQRQQCPGG